MNHTLMVPFILQLTAFDGSDIYVNLNQVCYIAKDDELRGTWLHFDNAGDAEHVNAVLCQESIDTIVNQRAKHDSYEV